jgi:uncharacterized damage-inducible protein DinB
MSADSILPALFRYQAWAHDAFLQKLEALGGELHANERQAALRVLNHCYVVNQIFTAHLAGTTHGFAADNTPDTPTPQALRAALAASDRWFLEYVAAVTPEQLAEPVAFTFTDGDSGRMTRAEMLLHVATHGGYHRGEVGRILKQIGAEIPWDTFAVHLHQAEPERRLRA